MLLKVQKKRRKNKAEIRAENLPDCRDKKNTQTCIQEAE